MLYKNVLDEGTYSLLKKIMKDDIFCDYFLVGGTALALQIGHRKSVDLDLFTQKDINIEEIKNHLQKNYDFEVSLESHNTLKGFIDKVQIDFIKYEYRLIDNIIIDDNIRMLSIKDIIPMKLVTIYQDGTRIKDFIDIAYLSNKYTLNEMIELSKNKYGYDNTLSILKGITFFDNIDYTDSIMMINKNYSFDKVKKVLINMINNPDKKFILE